MNEEIKLYLTKYPEEITELFNELRKIIYKSVSFEPEEKLWAKIPSYYNGEKLVRLIPFKDHINIEAKTVTNYVEELDGYKITPKGMLQIFIKQDIPADILTSVFAQTLS